MSVSPNSPAVTSTFQIVFNGAVYNFLRHFRIQYTYRDVFQIGTQVDTSLFMNFYHKAGAAIQVKFSFHRQFSLNYEFLNFDSL